MKKPAIPPDVAKFLADFKREEPLLFLNLLESNTTFERSGEYKHWDRLRYAPLPEHIPDHEFWWILIKLKRRNNYKDLNIKGIDNIPFKFIMLDEFQKTTHFLDQFASGNIAVEKPILNPQMKDYYLISSLMEESITSSQLEGATTTRDIAKKMIRENRAPRNKSEQMIMNNYEAINFARSVKRENLSAELIKEVHRIISKGTLDDPEKSGVYRNETDDIRVMTYDNELIFTPPVHSEIEKRIAELCEFANSDDPKIFIHPVIKAVIIHFLLSYIHPFIDGNGRTARALFYWYMLKKGYWLAEFISISRILKNAPAKYTMSYLYTETDENDLTYFIDYQLKTIRRAIDELKSYIKRKMSELESAEKLLKNTKFANVLNIRQLAFLESALKSPGTIYTIQEYKNMHNVVYQTARQDLLDLSDVHGLVIKLKKGKTFVFMVPADLEARLK